MQTRWHSFIESAVGTAIGFIVSLISQLIIFPIFDIVVSMSVHLIIVLYFTVISIIRVYCIRRVADRITERALLG